VWDPNKNREKAVVLSRNYEDILEFAGYDGRRWTRGFADWKDIFTYVSSREGFMAKPYILEGRRKASLARDARNPCYMGFLNWLEDSGFFKKEDPLLQTEAWEAQARKRFPQGFLLAPENERLPTVKSSC
jgi:hypothetical protein